MSKKDTKAKEYIREGRRFADICNLVLYNGEKVLSAENLTEKDSTEVLSILGISRTEVNHQQKWRDLLRGAVIKTSEKAIFVLIGIENQSDIHYAMPVKSMIYDALSYGSQVKEAAKTHRKNKDYDDSAEFLSGFKKTDKLIPVIPITLYLGMEQWDGPVSLHEMFGDLDERLKSFIPDYKIALLSPLDLTLDDLNKLDTDLREFFGAIKYSNSWKEFENFILGNPAFENMDNETLSAINLFTGANIKLDKKGGKTNVCKAIRDMREQERAEGIEQGIEQGIAKEFIENVESLKLSLEISLEQAVGILGKNMKDYEDAQELLKQKG